MHVVYYNNIIVEVVLVIQVMMVSGVHHSVQVAAVLCMCWTTAMLVGTPASCLELHKVVRLF